MRVETIIGITLLCPLASGCSLAKITWRNLTYECLLAKEECLEKARFCKLAEEAWAKCQAHNPQPYSKDYADGFKAGFIDYIDAGDNPDPAWLLPKCYQKLRYETPEGHQAMQDWFAGFRQGEAAAKESGYRDLLILNLPVMSLPPPPPVPPGSGLPPGTPVPSAVPPALSLPAPVPADAPPVLSPPRRLPPPGGKPGAESQGPENGPAVKIIPAPPPRKNNLPTGLSAWPPVAPTSTRASGATTPAASGE
jgi:hypothetical protein